MDFIKIITEIEKIDPEIYERLDTRRRVFQHVSGLGKKLSAAALPGLVSMLFNKAYGQSGNTSLPQGIVDILNLALQLEYLEYYFYDKVLTTTSLLNTADAAAVTAIRNDESGHIKVLREALGTRAKPQSAPTADAFDYTAGGRFPNVFTSAAVFFTVAQCFEDLGVRAYKGAAPKLLSNKTLLETALNIHSVEARHASHIRTLRRGLSAGVSGPDAAQALPSLTSLATKPKSWISGTDADGPSAPFTAAIYGAGSPAVGVAAQLFYPAESNVTQVGINVQTTPMAPTNELPLNAASASEAFDEALNDGVVKDIALNFRSALGASIGLELFQ
ncbi:ferritin-like domain-containing protein [Hymenobacter sp. ASUV-10]|uniref:Ferritin-like domain-containing protein n=1 Tax=Hymenobacter aranciens TaxID=3063996 RepID=A0ABT9B8P4_9BACT|nr:ferritin-like domain-containing protein [Hymenobacter sp. ASUV-10]MDO7874639.1 ferritin-like domain-containing protein [Hymenobacter sp. ASUV-10]